MKLVIRSYSVEFLQTGQLGWTSLGAVAMGYLKAAAVLYLCLGVLTTLYTLVADAIHTLLFNPDAVEQLPPTSFNWPVYLAGLLLITWPLLMALWPSARMRW